MIRLGLCCIFVKEDIRFRTTTAAFLQRLQQRSGDPFEYLARIVFDNILALQKAITFCAQNHIGCFRITSTFLPLATYPDFNYTIDDLPNAESLKNDLKKCQQIAADAEIRLSFHPDQFVLLNSPKEDVIEKSIASLEYHSQLAEIFGADVINIHGGGGYGNKEKALERLVNNFERLSPAIKQRLTLENDDKVYTPADLLPICQQLNIPLVYDVHHHRCLSDGNNIEDTTAATLKTWNRPPLFHISSPKEGWKGKNPQRHHDYINPHDMPSCWKNIDNLTIEVEAKAKELAVKRLRKQLLKRQWPLW